MLALYPLIKVMKGFKFYYFCLIVIFFSISVHTFDRLGSPKIFLPTYNRAKIPKVFTKKITNNIQKLLESNKIVWEQKNISMKIEDGEFLKNLVIRSKKLFKSNKDERFIYFEKEIIKHFDVLLAAEILSRKNKNRKGVV